MVKRKSDELVAIRHYNSNGATVRMAEDGTVYSWVPRSAVSLAWVQEKHVGALLAVQAKICCGKKANKFQLANEMSVSVWETGDRPTPEFLAQYLIS